MGPELIRATAAVFVQDLLPRAQLGAFVHFWTNLTRPVRHISNDQDPIESATIGTCIGNRARKKRMPIAFAIFLFGVVGLVIEIGRQRRSDHAATVDRTIDLVKVQSSFAVEFYIHRQLYDYMYSQLYR